MTLKTTCLGLSFENPIVLASGIVGLTASSMKHAVENGCGAVTVKSISSEPRSGHPNPTMFGTENYFMNAVGLSNAGIVESLPELKKYKEICDAPLIGSVFAGTAKEFVELSEKCATAPIDMLELNLSCPNVGNEFDDPFAYSTEAIETITKGVKEKVNVPIAVKLSPNAWNIGELAKAAEAAGSDALTVVNTVSGLMIDVRTRMPILHNRYGGVSGPALFPIALKCVYDCYKAVDIPIIGTGGITTGEDALAMIMAGATLLGVGSAVYYRGDDAFAQITAEMKTIMQEENITSLDEIRGCAH